MEKAPAEMLKEYVRSQKFSSTTEIVEAMKREYVKIPDRMIR
jgi:hypothetical protein